jgi:hypothetical protein
MAIILALYTGILALAVWQENEGPGVDPRSPDDCSAR